MGLLPLPIRTRVYAGESLDSYASRLAARHFSTVREVEDWLRLEGLLTGRGRRSPDRAAAWRALGALRDEAFTQPRQVGGNWVTDRVLCHHCAPPVRVTRLHPRPRPADAPDDWEPDLSTEPPKTIGMSAETVGRLPGVGRVCLKHRRWLGTRQVAVHDQPDLMASERRFRRVLAPRGVTFDAPVMRLALEAAAAASDPATLPDGEPLDRALYPLQIRFACLLTDAQFLTTVVLPRRGPDGLPDLAARNATIRGAVARILPGTDDEYRWRAEGRIQTVAHRLMRHVLDTRKPDGHITDDAWNLSRFLREP